MWKSRVSKNLKLVYNARAIAINSYLRVCAIILPEFLRHLTFPNFPISFSKEKISQISVTSNRPTQILLNTGLKDV